MNFKIKYYLICTALIYSLIQNNTFACEALTPQGNIYNLIAQENLKSLNSIDTAEPAGLCAYVNEIEENGTSGYIKSILESQLHPTEYDRQRLILKLLAKNFDENIQTTQSQVLDEITWQDLNILCGPKSNNRMHLASKITNGRTVTAAGTATILRMLIQPTSNIEALQTQQSITKELINNQPFFDELNKRLKHLVIPENALLSFWNPEDIFTLMFEQMQLKIPLEDRIETIKKLSEWVNKTPLTLEAYSRVQGIFTALGTFMLARYVVQLSAYALTGNDIFGTILTRNEDGDPIYNLGPPTSALVLLCLIINTRSPRGAASLSVYDHANQTYEIITDMQNNTVIYTSMHKKISYIAKYLQNLKEMAHFVTKNSVLTSKMPAVQNFIATLEDLNTTTSDFRQLLELLETDTFKCEYSWLIYYSRVMVAYKLMIEQKDQFIEAMLAIGELDAQLTIAKLYKESQKSNATFCFPTFLSSSNSTNPAIKAVEFWNPLLDQEKAVTNSIEIGEAFASPQNVIITGPNAAGKSTITRALIYSIILAQSLGITPAKTLTFTPFSNIMTYLNITDDIAAGNSHFKAGVIRARQLIETSNNLHENEFGLFGIDEVFNGTTFKEGQAAAFTLIEELGRNPKNICVTNTHFPLITTLENSGLFRNYKVSVIEKQGEKIQYTFTLQPGISRQTVALKILEEEGFGDAFVKKAQQILS